MSLSSFADYAIAFNEKLKRIKSPILPQGYTIMNPFRDGVALSISTEFYRKYYSDKKKRRLILGINPGRHGAGLTGVPFTDTKHLQEPLQIDPRSLKTYELSATFIYAVIAEWGGAKSFYKNFYINSPLPLGLLLHKEKNKVVNANYYDNRLLTQAVAKMIEKSMADYMTMPLEKNVVYCLGQSKNYEYLNAFNQEKSYFAKVIPLPHPRYIMQYQRKQLKQHIKTVCETLSKTDNA